MVERVRRASGGAVALLTSAVLVGCGSSGKPAADAPSSAGTSASAASLPDDVCSVVTAADLSTAIGSPVTTQTGPSGDCEFNQDDARALSGSVGIVKDAEVNGGLDGYLAGLTASLTDPRKHQLDGLGDGASVVVGVPAMSSNLMAGGAVDHGTHLLVVTLVQAKGETDQHLTAAAEKVLRVLDTKLD